MLRPPPIRSDGSNAFARYSMQVRVPRIARDVVNRERPPALVRDAIERLACALEEDRLVPAAGPPGPDLQAWTALHAERPGETWLAAQWFYAEYAFYRELAAAFRFWETGRDPFAGAKEAELADSRLWTRLAEETAHSTEPRDERVHRLLDATLWGNRVDLSYAVATAQERRQDSDLLVDERAGALAHLLRSGARVHFVTDNTGTELALDLALVDALLEDATACVTVHLKMQPVFVSDAMACDLWRLVERMHERGGDARALGSRLRGAFDDGRLTLAPDPYWSASRFLWEAPGHVMGALASATAVVIKGDANYRRVVGDALWKPTTPLAQVAAYLPSPTLCLRTMKSDAVAGLPDGVAEALDAADPSWRVDGRRGLAQTVVPPAR